MAVKLEVPERDGIYFITFTCQDWLPLFALTTGYNTAYNWFDWLKKEGHFITGYVIMPNHVHLLLAVRHAAKSVNAMVSNGKRFMAYELVKRLEEKREEAILQKLTVSSSDKKRSKLHQVFTHSFDCKECRTKKFILQKLANRHANPCSSVWNRTSTPEEYLHSSARYYYCGEHSAYVVTHYMEPEDTNLTS